jgi:hypothetical protein
VVSGGETDSSTAIYTYDGSARLINKKEFHARIAPAMTASGESAAAPDPSDVPGREIKSQRTDVTAITFNLAGILTGESTNSTDPRFTTRTEYAWNNYKLEEKYTKYDNAGKITEAYHYTYLMHR